MIIVLSGETRSTHVRFSRGNLTLILEFVGDELAERDDWLFAGLKGSFDGAGCARRRADRVLPWRLMIELTCSLSSPVAQGERYY